MSGLALAKSKWGPGKAPRMVHDHAGEMALVARIKNGEEAKQRLVEIYWERIRQTAEGYYRPGMHMDVDDLTQEGAAALLQAAVDYEPDSGRNFVEWVSAAISNGVRRAIFNGERTVRIPSNIELDIARVLKRQEKLEEELGRKPTVKELAQAVSRHNDWPHQRYWGRASVDRLTGRWCRIPRLADNDDLINDLFWIFNWLAVASLEEVDTGAIEDLDAGDLTDEVARSILSETIRRELDLLPEEERRILELRFGFEGDPWRLEKIGQELDLTRERVRQLEGGALNKLAAYATYWPYSFV